MTSEQFVTVWSDWQLRQYLVDACKMATRCEELREDCLQHAAMMISQEPTGQRSIDWYAEIGRKAIRANRQKEIRYQSGRRAYIRKYQSYMKKGRM